MVQPFAEVLYLIRAPKNDQKGYYDMANEPDIAYNCYDGSTDGSRVEIWQQKVLSRRHSQAVNIAFADLHAAKVSHAELMARKDGSYSAEKHNYFCKPSLRVL